MVGQLSLAVYFADVVSLSRLLEGYDTESCVGDRTVVPVFADQILGGLVELWDT